MGSRFGRGNTLPFCMRMAAVPTVGYRGQAPGGTLPRPYRAGGLLILLHS